MVIIPGHRIHAQKRCLWLLVRQDVMSRPGFLVVFGQNGECKVGYLESFICAKTFLQLLVKLYPISLPIATLGASNAKDMVIIMTQGSNTSNAMNACARKAILYGPPATQCHS